MNREGKSEVIFAKSDDVDKIWSNIVSAIDTEPLKSKLEKDKSFLQYLDARFGNKVFYKFTNSQAGDIIQSTSNSPHATSTATTTRTR